MNRNSLLSLLLFGLVASLASFSSAQFTTVLNIPPDPDLADNADIGSGTQVNLGPGGAFGDRVEVAGRLNSSPPIEVNIAGGTVGERFTANFNTVINISGGNIGRNAHFRSIDVGTFSGGTIGDSFDVSADPNVGGFTISGSEFKLNGVPIAGLDNLGDSVVANVPTDFSDYLLTGVLVDGTPFAFSRLDFDLFRTQPTLVAASVPSIGPALITASAGNVPLGIRNGQTLLVDAAGTVADNFNAHYGSTVEVKPGGNVGDNLEVVGGTLLIEGGTVRSSLDAIQGTSVTMTGGELGSNAHIADGSTLNASGGTIDHSTLILEGATLNMSGTAALTSPRISPGGTALINGGKILSSLGASATSVVTIAGGALGGHARFNSGSDVTFRGAEFQINGAPIAGLATPGDTTTVTIPEGSLISGTLADGTPFAYRSGVYRESDLEDATLTLEVTSLPQIGPAIITASTDPIPLGIRTGQTLLVDAGSMVPASFHAGPGSTLHVQPGSHIGESFKAVGATVNVSGGDIAGGMKLYNGTSLEMNGGNVENSIDVAQDSTLSISGGSLGDEKDYQGIYLYDTAVMNISGGLVNLIVNAESGSELNIYGTEFFLDGVLIDDLTLDLPTLITERGSILSGKLLDGSFFNFSLYNFESSGSTDYIVDDATVNIIRSLGTADFNEDEIVDATDLAQWQAAYGTTDAADANDDGESNGADLLAWQRQAPPGSVIDSTAVPEPTSLLLLALALAKGVRFRAGQLIR